MARDNHSTPAVGPLPSAALGFILLLPSRNRATGRMANAWLLKHLLSRGHEVSQNCKLWPFLKKWWPGRYKYKPSILYSTNILGPEIF